MSKKSRRRKKKLRKLRQLQQQQKKTEDFSYENVKMESKNIEKPEIQEEKQITKYIKRDVLCILFIGGSILTVMIILYFINQRNDILSGLIKF